MEERSKIARLCWHFWVDERNYRAHCSLELMFENEQKRGGQPAERTAAFERFRPERSRPDHGMLSAKFEADIDNFCVVFVRVGGATNN